MINLKSAVLEANLLLPKYGLAPFTWGNASGFDRESGLMAIKPSGVAYERLSAADMVVIEVESGKIVEGKLRPSSDTPTHLELYRRFPDIGGVVHTHSRFATAFAQAKRSVPALGTTHADHFYGEIPCTRELTEREIAGSFEAETGVVIAEHFAQNGISPLEMPAVLVACHGPFAWGKTALDAAENAAVLEIVAEMALNTLALSPDCAEIPGALLDRHFFRKHGSGAYYGQG